MIEKKIFYKKRLFWWVCGLPTLAAIFYLFIWATPRYESISVLRVYAFSEGGSGSGSMSMGMGGSASPGSYILKEIVRSWECFDYLDKSSLEKQWKKGDFFTRFGGIRSLLSTNPMRLWTYYKSHVTARIDDESGLVRLNVDSYDPDFSYAVNRNVLEFVQNKLQKAGLRAYQAERAKLEDHVVSDRRKLENDLSNMEEFQKQYGIADYDEVFSNTLSLINHFQNTRVTTEGKAASAKFFAERSQALAALQAQLATLDKHIEKQQTFVLKNLSPQYKRFSSLRQTIAEDVNVIQLDDQNLQDVEQLAYRSSYHVDVIENPVHPTNATMPLALLWSCIILAATFVLYLIVK